MDFRVYNDVLIKLVIMYVCISVTTIAAIDHQSTRNFVKLDHWHVAQLAGHVGQRQGRWFEFNLVEKISLLKF